MAGKSAAALAAYRSLVKAARKSFSGDTPMINQSLAEIRQRFEANRQVNSPVEAERLVDKAKEAAHFIRPMIVQAKLNDQGGYVVKPDKEHAGGSLEIPSEENLDKLIKGL